eukprot:symbB.v1.2.008960.t1/scaffold508.1/size221222/9
MVIGAALSRRPVSATSKEAEWVSSPSAAEARPSSQGFGGSVAANAARRAMSISEDLHIQEDYSEDNELEEAIERIRASEPYTRRAARCGRTAAPQESAPRMAASEFVDPPRAQYDGSSGVKQPAQPAPQRFLKGLHHKVQAHWMMRRREQQLFLAGCGPDLRSKGPTQLHRAVGPRRHALSEAGPTGVCSQRQRGQWWETSAVTS